MFRCDLGSYAFSLGSLRGGSRVQRRSHSLTSSGTAPGDRRRPVDPAAKPGNRPVPDPGMLQVVLEPSSAEDEAPDRELADQPDGTWAADGTVVPGGTSAADDTVVLARTVLPPAPPSRPPGAVRAAELPSWPQVLATTLRLWAQRRLARARWRWIIAVVLVAIVLGAAAITVALIWNAPGRGEAGNGALGAAASARSQAATWVAQQVAADAIVACDPAMCSVLQGKGIPASRLLVLQSGNADPLGSEVVMATAAVRSQFGSRLASVYAPEVLVSFGAGSARIVIRAVATEGGAAYRAALHADVQARMAVGQQLLANSRLHASATARRQLAAGEVDARLLTTLATLAALYPIDVAGFGGPGAHARAGVPLRSADISGATGVANARSAVSLSSLKGFLLAQRAPYLPAEMDTVQLATGQAVLRVEFTAPSPLGLLGTDG